MEQENLTNELNINQNSSNVTKKNNVNFFAGLSVAVVVTIIGSTWWAVHTISHTNESSLPTVLVPANTESNLNIENITPEIYWLKTTDKSLEFVPLPVTMEKSVEEKTNLEAIVKRLLAGINSKEYTTAIPKGTKLLDINVRGNEIFVNLSPQFTTGGGSASMVGRLGQLIYTATSLNPKAKVWLEIEGKTLEVLGGEGVMLEQPLTRQYFESNLIDLTATN